MINTKIKYTLAFLFLSFTFYAQEYSGNGQDINNILATVKSFSEAYINADYDALTNIYSTDGKIFPDGADIIIGHTAIKKRWTLPKGVKIVSHKVTPKEIKIIDDYAYDYGYYQGSSSNKKGTVTPFKGKYVIVWKKVDGNWKIYLDIWNRISDKKN